MISEENLTPEDVTMYILHECSKGQQFRINTLLSSALHLSVPSPSTRWYDYCSLHWPNDAQISRMDRYIRFEEIIRQYRSGHNLRSILARKGYRIGFRWRRRRLDILDTIEFFDRGHEEKLQHQESD